MRFSDEEDMWYKSLLLPILIEQKFKSIPKLVICQFCRGRSLETAVFDDLEFANKREKKFNNADDREKVNGQERFLHIIIVEFSYKISVKN